MSSQLAERYESETVEVVCEGERAIVHDRLEDRYFESTRSVLSEAWRDELRPIHPRAGYLVAVLLLTATAAGIAISLALLAIPVSSSADSNLVRMLAVIVYAVVNVFLHEVGHITALRAFGRRPDKVGVKLHFWLFPAVYVRMSQSILLTKYERVVVHVAGLFVNSVLAAIVLSINAVYVGSDAVVFAVGMFLVAVLFNAVPLLNSDGYRVVLALSDTHERKEKRKNPWWILVLKVGSVIYVAWYVFDIVKWLVSHWM